MKVRCDSDFACILFYTLLDVTLVTSDISLPVIYQDYEIGRAILPDLALIPGTNVVKALVHYQRADSNSTKAQDLLTNYISTPDGGATGVLSSNLVIDGSSKADSAPLSPYESIQQALEGFTVRSVLDGIGARLTDEAKVFIEATSLCSNLDGSPEVTAQLVAHDDLVSEEGRE